MNLNSRGRWGGQAASRALKTRCAVAVATSQCAASTPAAGRLNLDGCEVIGASVRWRANGVLALMDYPRLSDVTTGSFATKDATASNPGFGLTPPAAGWSWSRDLPRYLKGTADRSRHAPTFVATNNLDSGQLPANWSTITGTGGAG